MMKKEKMKLKALMLSLALAALMLPATTVSAQGYHGGSLLDDYYAEQDASQGGLLRSGSSGGYSLSNEQFSGSDGGYQLSNETFGQDAPLGSGLFILAAAGAAYALRKRKTNK